MSTQVVVPFYIPKSIYGAIYFKVPTLAFGLNYLLPPEIPKSAI
jgi:hypothetical protein